MTTDDEDWKREALAVLREVEWQQDGEFQDDYWCPVCGAHKDDGAHKPDCRLAKLIGAKVRT